MTNKYTLLENAYYGTGIFENGQGLRQHPRESIENYIDRKGLAYYLNYTAPIVNAGVDPIFKNNIKREYKLSAMFEMFLIDCDRSKTTYQDFCKSAALHAKLYGAVFVIVDNSSEHEETKDEALKNRSLPFLKFVVPSQVVDWEMDNYGRLTMFKYKETFKKGANQEITQIFVWTKDTWEIGEGEKKKQGNHNLGRVPVVQWYARNTKNTDIKPPSEYLSVAQTNYTLYQLCSWHIQILRDQAFSILTMPDIGDEDITIGTNNVLTYPTDATHTPNFIAPPAAPATMLTDQMDRLIKEMYRMSGLETVMGVRGDYTKTGVAKQWDFEKTNKRLADFSARCESADKEIIELYEAWAGETVNYQCEYPRNFKINDVTESLANAQMALELGFDSEEYKQEVLKKVLESYLPNISSEVYDKIVNEVSEHFNDKKEENIYKDTDVNEDNEDEQNG
nr:MAG TPA: portal protein [Caudoviricetes sp.]